MKRNGIYWVRLDPAEGSEIGKTRPCVVVSLDALNVRLNTVVICPITSRLHPGWRTRLPVVCAGKKGEICVDQIRTVSVSRLGAKVDQLDSAAAQTLRLLINDMYGQP